MKKEISELQKVLSENYALYLKTQNYHWNVRGKLFRDVHLLTEEHYNNLFEAIDELAERIRALGFIAPGSFKEFANLTNIEPGDSNKSDEAMIADLFESHQQIVKNMRIVLNNADEVHDEVTVDMLIERLTFHEKAAWMFRSFLEQ